MPRPSIPASAARWRVVADFIATEKRRLDMDQGELVDTSQVSQSVVSKMENARPDNGRFAVESLQLVAMALLQHPDALIELANGADPDMVRQNARAYWNRAEELGGWEQFHRVPEEIPDRRRARRTAPEDLLNLDLPLAANRGRRARASKSTRKRPSPPPNE